MIPLTADPQVIVAAPTGAATPTVESDAPLTADAAMVAA